MIAHYVRDFGHMGHVALRIAKSPRRQSLFICLLSRITVKALLLMDHSRAIIVLINGDFLRVRGS